MKRYTYKVHTYSRGVRTGYISAESIEDATRKVKDLHPRFTNIKVECEI